VKVWLSQYGNQVLIILAGIVGWALNEISTIFRLRHETKIKFRLTLFNIMELYYFMGKLNFQPAEEELVKYIRSRFPEAEDEIEKVGIKRFLSQVYMMLLMKIDGPKVQSMKERYELSVKDLAAIDPFHAYQLSGKSDILNFFDEFKEWINDIGMIADAPMQNEADLLFLDSFKKEVFTIAICNLEERIRALSIRIGFITYIRSLGFIRRNQRQNLRELENILDKILKASSPVLGSN
jgi:hypothetical protein